MDRRRIIILLLTMTMVKLSFSSILDIEFDTRNDQHIQFRSYDKNVVNNLFDNQEFDLGRICKHLHYQKILSLSIWNAPVYGWFSLNNIFHEFLVYETRGLTFPFNGTSYWSIEKNSQGFELQHSSKKEDIINFINNQKRATPFAWITPQKLDEIRFSFHMATDALLSVLRE